MSSPIIITPPTPNADPTLDYQWCYSLYARITTGIKFSLTPSGTQSIPSGADTLVTFNTIGSDTLNGFNTSTNLYTCQDSGSYHLTVGVELSGTFTTSNTCAIKIIKNGATIVARYKYSNTALQNPTLQISKLVDLSRNDTIGVYAFQDTGSSISTVVSNNCTYFQAHRIN